MAFLQARSQSFCSVPVLRLLDGKFVRVEQPADQLAETGPVLARHCGRGLGIARFTGTDEFLVVVDGVFATEES